MKEILESILKHFDAHPYLWSFLLLFFSSLFIYYRGLKFKLGKYRFFIPNRSDREKYMKLIREVEHYQKPSYLAESKSGLTSIYIPGEPSSYLRGFFDDITHTEGIAQLRKRIDEIDSLGMEHLELLTSTLQRIVEGRLQNGKEFRIYCREEMEALVVTKFCRYPNLVVNGRRYDSQGQIVTPPSVEGNP